MNGYSSILHAIIKTEAQWNTVNTPIPLNQIVYAKLEETPIQYYKKIGDGVHTFKELPRIDLTKIEIEKLLATINTDISNLNTSVSGIQGDITTINSNISSLNTDISSVKSDITTLKSDMTTVQGDVSTLKTDMTSIKSDITTIEGDVNSIKSLIPETASPTNKLVDEEHMTTITIRQWEE